MNHPLYRIAGPTAWATPPESWSYSSLTAVERCPRQWLLAQSRYGDLPRFPSRPQSAAVEGDIVHSCLDRLFKTLAVRGMPPPGTQAFSAGFADVDVQGNVRRLIMEHEARLAEDPRAAAFRLRRGPQQLVNQVIRLFRGLYQEAVAREQHGDLPRPVERASGQIPTGPALAAFLHDREALSELPLTHPTLPFRGILDLIWLDKDGSVLTDFKTGAEKPEHRQQIAYYSLLWWRQCGAVPDRAEVRYPGRSVAVPLSEGFLTEVECELARRLAAVAGKLTPPAEAVPGLHCRHCDVRQFCDRFWSEQIVPLDLKRSSGQETSADVEVTVVGEPTRFGFDARMMGNVVLPVVFKEEIASIQGAFFEGERLRILGAQAVEGSLELKAWTEVFRFRQTAK